MISYSTQTVSKSDIKRVSNVLRSDWLTQEPLVKKLGFKKGLFKKSEEHAETAISLSIYPKIKKKEVLKIIRLVLNFEKKYDK